MSEALKAAARRLSASAIREGYKPEALHEYRDAENTIRYWRIRLKRPADGEKWIRPMYLNGKNYEIGEPEFKHGKPLYRLPDLLARPDDPVWFVEGENKADCLEKLGMLATTSDRAAGGHRYAELTSQRRRGGLAEKPSECDGGRSGQAAAGGVREGCKGSGSIKVE